MGLHTFLLLTIIVHTPWSKIFADLGVFDLLYSGIRINEIYSRNHLF